MPPRINPTARQVRLGTELRKLREAAGVTARDTAARLSASHTQVSHIESGRFGISEERLRTLAAFYVCDDADLVDALVAMASERGKGWWEEYRGALVPQALDLAELEHHATYLRTLQVLHIPGILQTEDRVRAAFAYVNPDLPANELEAEVTHRMRRREVIEREGAPAFEAVVHEAALRIKVGGVKSSRAQLEHILALSERDNVTVRVIPFDVDDFAGAGFSMLYAGGAVSPLDTVQLDTAHGSIFLDAEAQLRKYRGLFDRIEASSLTADASRDFIHRIARDM
ncbi:helix-turn-helix transcriptional regulator [Streptomyces sp. RKAG293]|uniref:helix-turn-helix domain-containing protein n=1 Tax=Streptomyces sp. RKAG293 TaxID=2893403 RepID=UPI0020341450|nr:helix-turn-helix transcriptional regulator [Streptomyces sp. RKAG293]MCM2419633.1 helix-turn-helix transcriptional regulator [Streptomyces sp. RKAG293]